MPKPGVLHIVATPIGDPLDITLRALEVLRQADAVICEEAREGSSLIKKLGLPPKELVCLNEHNETRQAQAIVDRLLNGQSLALVSDCGTPVFSDPGAALIQQVSAAGITVVPVPGPSSLMAALSILDFKPERFVFAGFLPRQPEKRRQDLQRYKAMRMPVILMDTPYRLSACLADAARIFGPDHSATLACDLTLPGEKIYRGSLSEIQTQSAQKKAEFILILS